MYDASHLPLATRAGRCTQGRRTNVLFLCFRAGWGFIEPVGGSGAPGYLVSAGGTGQREEEE